MNNYTEAEVLKAIREFDENPLHYENVSIEAAYIAIDCMREYIINKRKGEHTEKRGRWVERAYDRKQCTYCGKCEDNATDFCPNCGADMRGENNG